MRLTPFLVSLLLLPACFEDPAGSEGSTGGTTTDTGTTTGDSATSTTGDTSPTSTSGDSATGTTTTSPTTGPDTDSGNPTTGSTGGTTGGVCPAGDEDCPCDAGDTCNGFLACQEGTCVDPFPDCGNGNIDGSETCDDGNEVQGDGCGFDCQTEELCAIAHEGGDPISIRSVKVSPVGELTEVASLNVQGSYTAGEPGRRAIVGCGRHAYFVISSENRIGGVEVGLDGSLSALPSLPTLDALWGLQCGPDASTLVAMGGSGSIRVATFGIEGDGTLTAQDEDNLIYSLSNFDGRDALHLPGSRNIILLAWAFDFNNAETVGSRLSYDENGQLSQEQHPVSVAGDTLFGSASLAPDGSRLLMPGYSGGCIAWYDLGAGGSIPAQANLNVTCNPFGNGQASAVNANDVFYVLAGGSPPVLKVGEFLANGAMDHGSFTIPATPGHLQLAYDGSVMLLGSGGAGNLTSYTASQNKITLTQADQLSTGAGGDWSSTALVPCPN